MRSLKDFIVERKDDQREVSVDDKTIFYLFRKIIREQYGIRGESELAPVVFTEGVLSVKANNPLYSNELWMYRTLILERLNKDIGGEIVKEIRIVSYTPSS